METCVSQLQKHKQIEGEILVNQYISIVLYAETI